MKIIKYKKIKSFFSFITLSICFLSPIHGQEPLNNGAENTTPEVADIVFRYENESLDTIINQLAEAKNINIILPQGEIATIKVTLHIEQKLTLLQAWDVINSLLDVAGFSMVPQGNMIRIIKNSKEIVREPMPTYIGVSPDAIPNNDQQIRYLYYLANIKVSDAPENELNGILKDLLPENTLVKGDSATNGLLIVGKANDIRGAMKIITELDRIDFQEKVDIISLNHTSASIVAQLINEQLIKSENANPYRLDTKKAKEVPYFSGFTKIIPETRLNKLIILGRPQAVERLKDFIKKYIDVAPDSGKSILHVYQLQYLDAQQLAPVLMQIVQGGNAEGPSQASGGESAGGIERFFDKVIIYTDNPGDERGDQANSSDGGGRTKEKFTYYGGNNLVIAARNDDWRQIKRLIEELDIPQRQVLIEVLIADLTMEDSRLLGSMTRLPDKVPLPDSMEFQAAMFGQPIPTELPAIPTTSLEADLLSNAYQTGVVPPTLANPLPLPVNTNLANFVQSGTTMLSLNDNNGSTWSIWQLLQLFTSTKILSHPHIMARNNKEATVSIGEERVLRDTVKDVASNYYGGATTIQFKKIPANLTVKITPRISSADTVNLQVFVDISAYESTSASDNTILKRFLQTNANIKSGGIFALGGLIKTNTITSVRETPLLGRIPIIGWFFKRKSNDIIKNNLTVFISPTIIEPRLRDGINEYTQDYMDIAKNYSIGNTFDSLRDPITRWFFKEEIDTVKEIDKFAQKDETVPWFGKEKKRKKKNFSAEEHNAEDATKIITQKVDKSVIVQNNSESLDDKLKNKVKDDPNPFIVS